MQYASTPARGDLAVWPYTELDLARITGANVLFLGAGPLVVDLVGVLVPSVNEGVTIRPRWGRLELPPASSHIGKVVVWDVGTLTLAGQRTLLEWMDLANGRTQVISIASAPLLIRVDTGAFDATLYYRLNTICIDLSK